MHIFRALSAILLITPAFAACSAGTSQSPEPATFVETRTSMEPKPRGEARLQSAMMRAHNDARARVGAPKLEWNAELTKDAAAYAVTLARNGKFAHDPQAGRNPRQGENLWMGTRDAYGYGEMIGAWVDEDRYFKRGLFPDNSTTGTWGDVAHYTQIIWPTSLRVGCAVASNARDDFLVCRYSPAGNIVGRDPLKG
ncbi:CAP domain-containing protein [Parasphingorhabdus flavimaris]|uniref:CAP domain-containing protein n=1 Tax=Parasphingorhabdus flavimaris TaxID=266812 RepID=UPI003003892A